MAAQTTIKWPLDPQHSGDTWWFQLTVRWEDVKWDPMRWSKKQSGEYYYKWNIEVHGNPKLLEIWLCDTLCVCACEVILLDFPATQKFLECLTQGFLDIRCLYHVCCFANATPVRYTGRPLYFRFQLCFVILQSITELWSLAQVFYINRFLPTPPSQNFWRQKLTETLPSSEWQNVSEHPHEHELGRRTCPWLMAAQVRSK